MLKKNKILFWQRKVIYAPHILLVWSVVFISVFAVALRVTNTVIAQGDDFTQFSVVPNPDLPEDNSEDIAMLIARDNAMQGNSLRARVSSAKFYFDGTGVKYVGIFDSPCSLTGESYDSNCDIDDSVFRFYITDENETITDEIAAVAGPSGATNGWYDFAIDASNAARSNATGKFVVIMEATFDQFESNTNSRNNGFKIRVSPDNVTLDLGGVPNVSNKGVVGFRAPGQIIEVVPDGGDISYRVSPASVSYNSFDENDPEVSNNGPNGAYAIQNRQDGVDLLQLDYIKFAFGVPCFQPRENDLPKPFYLRWTDADATSASGNPADSNIGWELWTTTGQSGNLEEKIAYVNNNGSWAAREYNYENETWGPETTSSATNRPASSYAHTLGGDRDGSYREFTMSIPDGTRIMWIWKTVEKRNGVQMWIPFDSYTVTDTYYNFLSSGQGDCPVYPLEDPTLRVQGTAVSGSPPTLSPADSSINNSVRIGPDPDTETSSPSPQSMPFNFEDMSFSDDKTFQVTGIPSGYTLLGYTICEANGEPLLYTGSEQPCDHTTMPLRGTGAGNTITVPDADNPADNNAYYHDVWLHFQPPEPPPDPEFFIRFHKVNTKNCQIITSTQEPYDDRVQHYNSPADYAASKANASNFTAEGIFEASVGNANIVEVSDSNPTWIYNGNSVGDSCSDRSTISNRVSIPVNSSSPSIQHVWFYYSPPDPEQPPEKKIYGANDVDITPDAVRDNRQLDIDVNGWLWPDVTHRHNSSGANNADTDEYLWTAGVYGLRSGDPNLQSGTNHPHNLNKIDTFNTAAELGCPETCANTVPLAYVPADDGSDVSNTDTKDGSRTEKGNNWHDIREESYGSNLSFAVGEVISCSSYDDKYTPKCGGRASRLNTDLGGATGNFLRNVEISNVHVYGEGLELTLEETGLQGHVPDRTLQVTEVSRKGLTNGSGFLPINSQGPKGTDPAWDNIRNPLNTDDFSIQSTESNMAFDNTENDSTSAGVRLLQPDAMTTTYYNRDDTLANVRSVSLLQDGRAAGPGCVFGSNNTNCIYDNSIEPLSYTAQIAEVENTHLRWDEYVDWTQIDDKGHWYTTNTTGVITGIDSGPINEAKTDTKVYTKYFEGGTTGSSSYTHNHANGQLCGFDENDEPIVCTHSHSRTANKQCISPTSFRHITKTYTWYGHRTEPRFGWYNTQTTTESMPYGGHGQTAETAFFPNRSSQPPWSDVLNYWQDSAVTSMDTSGSTNAPTHTNRWIYNQSDPMYSNRSIFDKANDVTYNDDYELYGESCRTYYTGGPTDGQGSAATVKSDSEHTVGTIYDDVRELTEWHREYAAVGIKSGGWGDEVTFDGNADGVVDTGWSWSSNQQRVRYEHTWEDHSRKLGPRYSVRNGGRKGVAATRPLLYGLEPTAGCSSSTLACATPASILASRGTAIIYNPFFLAANSDVFAGGGLDSYFRSSNVVSAFVFVQNGGVSNVNNQRTFNNYFINPDVDVAARLEEDNLSGLFTNLSQLRSQGAANGALPGSNNLGGKVYRYNGDTTLGNITFSGGAGTIIVEGDLTINGNLSYASGIPSSRDQLPSVGFIVNGDVIINDNVTEVVGAFAVNKCFIVDSRVGNAANNCTAYEAAPDPTYNGDPAFRLDGLVVADRFALLRQPSGAALRTNRNAEHFNYDGRVVVNNPPGFSRIFSDPANWIELTPRNR